MLRGSFRHRLPNQLQLLDIARVKGVIPVKTSQSTPTVKGVIPYRLPNQLQLLDIARIKRWSFRHRLPNQLQLLDIARVKMVIPVKTSQSTPTVAHILWITFHFFLLNGTKAVCTCQVLQHIAIYA